MFLADPVDLALHLPGQNGKAGAEPLQSSLKLRVDDVFFEGALSEQDLCPGHL
jgi:hypothetical protein